MIASRFRRSLAALSATFLLMGQAPELTAQTRVRGHARYELIKGNPSAGYRELYETNLFFTPANASQRKGRSRRLGTTVVSGSSCTNITVGNGEYCISDMEFIGGSSSGVIPSGTYSILVSEPLFYVAPKIIGGITITNGQDRIIHPELPLDYSTYDLSDWVGNTDDGDFRPASSPWYQTFEATGRSIRGASIAFAGTAPDNMAFAILHDNGDSNPANWTLVAERTLQGVSGPGSDNWVRWRSDEVPTLPEDRYALRVTGIGGPQGGAFQPHIRDKDGESYALGQAYDHTGTPQNHDLTGMVFSDNDGTVVTMNKRTRGMGTLKSPGYFATRWGQTFTALGTSLAGMDVKAAGGNGVWDIDFRWRVYPAQDPSGPTGSQIGPTKESNAAWNPGGFQQGVSYTEGEVPLTPGQTYMISFEAVNPPPESFGFNPYIMDDDSYSGGQGYTWTGSSWQSRPLDDVSMTILEYLPPAPIIEAFPESIEREAVVGGSISSQDTFTVQNVGFGILNYAFTESLNWLSVSPIFGNSSGEIDTITITYNNAVISSLPEGTYNGNITITDVAASNSPYDLPITLVVRPVAFDYDVDGDVDIDDYAHLQECFTGDGFPQAAPECQNALHDGDEDVDAADLSLFLDCLSGANVAYDPDCESP